MKRGTLTHHIPLVAYSPRLASAWRMPNLPTKIIPTKIRRLKHSGKSPMDLRIPPHKIQILPELNPLKSRILVREIGRMEHIWHAARQVGAKPLRKVTSGTLATARIPGTLATPEPWQLLTSGPRQASRGETPQEGDFRNPGNCYVNRGNGRALGQSSDSSVCVRFRFGSENTGLRLHEHCTRASCLPR